MGCSGNEKEISEKDPKKELSKEQKKEKSKNNRGNMNNTHEINIKLQLYGKDLYKNIYFLDNDIINEELAGYI